MNEGEHYANGGRARRYLYDALNGDIGGIDPPVRRGLFSNAESVDALRSEMDSDIEQLRAIVVSLRRAVVASSTAVIIAVMSSAVGVIYYR